MVVRFRLGTWCQQAAELAQQQSRVEGFGHHQLCACGQAIIGKCLRVIGGQENDRNIDVFLLPAHPVQHGQTVGHRHAAVEHGQIYRLCVIPAIASLPSRHTTTSALRMFRR